MNIKLFIGIVALFTLHLGFAEPEHPHDQEETFPLSAQTKSYLKIQTIPIQKAMVNIPPQSKLRIRQEVYVYVLKGESFHRVHLSEFLSHTKAHAQDQSSSLVVEGMDYLRLIELYQSQGESSGHGH